MGLHVKYVKIEEAKIKKDSEKEQGIGLEPDIIRILQRIGIKTGLSVLDFGCGSVPIPSRLLK